MDTEIILYSNKIKAVNKRKMMQGMITHSYHQENSHTASTNHSMFVTFTLSICTASKQKNTTWNVTRKNKPFAKTVTIITVTFQLNAQWLLHFEIDELADSAKKN